MLTKEQLLAAGLNEEQATAVLKLHTDSINGNYIPKHRFDEVNTKLKNAEEQVTERDKQIEGLKKFEGDNKALQDQIKTLQTDNETKNKEYQASLTLEQKKNALKLTLLADESGKPHDVDMVAGLFSLDKVEIGADGKITAGYKEQRETIGKEKAFLFAAKDAGDGSGAGGSGFTGFRPAGNPPAEGQRGGGTDTSVSFGKSLAAAKLESMGIAPKADATK